MRLWPIAATAVLLSVIPSARAQDVKYEKYKLDNGMTVILHEDHSLPVASINIWYSVGAKEEPPGRSGFAHLFEHLMFMGTKRVPGNDFDNLMEAGGGSNNANTTFDRTDYFSSGPSKILPTLLWLDADRLEDLGRTMDQDKLNKQRDVVRNEIRQQVENTPYGVAGEYVYRLMYPEGHPYHNAVYGTHEDLESATVWNVTEFFSTFYVPNNASLVVAGDFDPAAIKPLVAQLFGSLARGQEPRHRSAPAVHLHSIKRETMIDKCQLPKILMTFHSPGQYQDGDAEMSLAGALLSQGKNSRLYKRLVYEDKTAVSVSAYQDDAKLQSMFTVEILAKPGADLAAVEKTVDEELARLCADGPTQDELTERQATSELGLLASMQSIESRAVKLNEYEAFWGEPNSFKRDLDRYRNATPATVRDWARKVVTPDSRVILWILPQQPDRPATARDSRPSDLPPRAFTAPSPDTFTLANGLNVMLWQRHDLPLVSMDLLFKPGHPIDDPSHAGQASLAAAMLGEGAGDLDSIAFSAAMQSLGATFAAGADKETAVASLTVLKRNFGRAATLAADAVRRPRMDQKDWDRVKRLHLDSLRQEDDEPTIVAARVGLRSLFGDPNPYGWPSGGTLKTVEPMTLADIKARQTSLFRPEDATILIAGDLTPDEAKATLNKAFGDWKPAAAAAAPKPAPAITIPPSNGLRVVVVDRPEAVQTVIRFIMPGAKLADDRRVPLRLLNTLLGGSFTSRLNQNLRERNGYTYGAGSRFVMEPSTGYFIASSSVRADVTGKSLQEFLTEFSRLNPAAAKFLKPEPSSAATASGPDGAPKPAAPRPAFKGPDIPDAEAAKAAQTLRQDTIQAFAGLGGLIGQAAELTAAGLSLETVGKDLSAMQSVHASDLNALATKVLDLDHAVLVLVGDKRAIMAQLGEVNLPTPVELTPEGDLVSK